MLGRKQPARPHSRLQNIYEKVDKQNIMPVVGIPDKLISSSKPFPQFSEDDDKQNNLLLAPKKQQKKKSNNGKQTNQHVFRRRFQSEITKVLQAMQNRTKVFSEQKQNNKIIYPAEHLQIQKDCVTPFSQILRNQEKQLERINKENPIKISDQKSFARRVRERIEAENAKKQEKKKKQKIGEEAYLPFPLKELKNKIVEKSRKNSQEYTELLFL